MPKRVVLTARALHASAAATYEWLDARGGAGVVGASAAPDAGPASGARPDAELSPTRQWLHCLPAYYIAGAQVLLRSLVAGTRPVELRGRFTSEALVEAAGRMDGERRYVSLVPVQLQRLLEAAGGLGDAVGSAAGGGAAGIDAVMRRFDGVLVGGQSTPRPVLAAARERGWPIVTTYGASETSGGCAYDGEPLPGVRARLDDGELLLTGPQLAAGYLGDRERDARAFVELDGERWYRTSDAGTIAEEAGRVRLAVTGRLDHVIISGGEKVNLDVVERLVQQLPGYEQAVAVAVPHPEWGQAVAVVVPVGAARDAGPAEGGDGADRDDADLDALRAACAPAGRAARPVRLVRLPGAAPPRQRQARPPRPRRGARRRARRALRRRAAALSRSARDTRSRPHPPRPAAIMLSVSRRSQQHKANPTQLKRKTAAARPATVGDWIEGARLRTLPLAVVPVLLGTAAAIAAAPGEYHWVRALAALAVALLLQIGVNYSNDYSDGIRGTDEFRVGPAAAHRLGRGRAAARAQRRLCLLRGSRARRPRARGGHAAVVAHRGRRRVHPRRLVLHRR